MQRIGRREGGIGGMNDTHKCVYLFRTLAMPKSPNLTTPAFVRKIFCTREHGQ